MKCSLLVHVSSDQLNMNRYENNCNNVLVNAEINLNALEVVSLLNHGN